MYVWERTDWPTFRWDDWSLLGPLAEARHKQGLLLGRMLHLGFPLQQEARAEAITEEVVKSSEIEGEALNRDSVRSSIARQLGLPDAGLAAPVDRRTEGVVEMMLDATRGHAKRLTGTRLVGWHAALFPTGHSGLHRIKTGGWRDDSQGPMQVVSGAVHKPKVHFQAPPAKRIRSEMRTFLEWFNATPRVDGLLRTALAHFWFVTIHPFDDGNGRVARAVAEMALAQLESSEQRFYSVSSQIRRERADYYDVLERTQKGALDVTGWLRWFLGCYTRALEAADSVTGRVLRKAEFWQRVGGEALSERQRKVLNVLFGDFEGKLTAKKWAALAKCSVDTAQRDITNLVDRGLLQKNPGGSKNTSYALAG